MDKMYRRLRRSELQRFCAKVALPAQGDGCWLWTGLRRDGYGRFSPHKYVHHWAHRYAYEKFVGPVESGKQLDHLCRNRACVNPAHLEPVTCKENLQRGWAIRRNVPTDAEACAYGHRFTPENTYTPPSGRRECRQCRRRQVKQCKERRKARNRAHGP